MPKYTPLKNHLKAVPAGTNDLTLSFAQIELIINDRLPESAKKYAAWWGNELAGSHVQAHAWLDAGWRVEGHDLTHKWVRFVRS